MKKTAFLLISMFLIGLAGQAQSISPADLKILRKKEDSLKVLAKGMIQDTLQEDRMRKDSIFTRTLIRALVVKNSFFYPFDSVQGISKLYAPDSTFRIFTWDLEYDVFYNRQHGAIQYHTSDGSLKLAPLRDVSEFTGSPNDSMRTNNNWIGAVYYNIIKNSYQGKNYYTLFGYDANSAQSNKKWIDVLSFDQNNRPVFGGHFTFDKDSIPKAAEARFNIEYKKLAATTVNYDPEMQMILYDHLVSESEQPELPFTYIPDGDYEGFKWENGTWVHVEKVFTEKLEDGQFPMPAPIRDAAGNFTNVIEEDVPASGTQKPAPSKPAPKKKGSRIE